jgi:hypothetical protein
VIKAGLIPVTTIARTVCDVARSGEFEAALVALDSALAQRRTTLDSIAEVVTASYASPGSQCLSRLYDSASPHSESPSETIARHELRRAGHLAIPQVWAYDETGPIGCGDLWLPELWAYLEVDGDLKYRSGASPVTLVDEKHRQERLELAGFGVARVAAKDAQNARLLTERVIRAAQRGRLMRTSSPPTGSVGPPPTWAIRGSVIPWTSGRAP